MSKKSRGLVLDSRPPYGVGVYEDAKARLKHKTLMQDYQELQKEVDVMRSKLEADKQRKMILAAEVRFLRRRFEYLVKTKNMDSSKDEKLVQPPKLIKQTKTKKKHSVGKEVAAHNAAPAGQHQRKILRGGKEAIKNSLTLISDLNHNERIDKRKKTSARNTTRVLDLNQNDRVHANDATLRNKVVAFDLNQDNDDHSGNEASLPSRAPIFDLNEISTGDEDFQSNIESLKFDEVKKSLMRCPNDEVQNDLKLSICRNAGEGPSRVGKRKISWQDPVALRV